MTLLTLGMSHKTAPLNEREQWVFLPEQLPGLFTDLKAMAWVEETAIVSTCNRVEFYIKAQEPDVDQVLDFWSHARQASRAHLKPFTYLHWDDAAVKHLLRVASGLDSLVVGEPQILGQMKQAYRQAQQHNMLGRHLRHLFEYGFHVAKLIRTETDIGVNPVSVASTAVLLAKRIFSELSQKQVLLIGAGETIELVAQHLMAAGIQSIVVANRTLERANRIAETVQGRAIVLEQVAEYLADADIVVSSTASPLPIIGKGLVEAAMKKRKYEPMLMIDLAVPRDIEKEVEQLTHVFIYCIDDLESVISQHCAQRFAAAAEAETLVAYQADQYRQQVQSWQADDVVRSYRDTLVALHDKEIKKALQAVEKGADSAEVLKRFGHNLINKIMHGPTVELRKIAEKGQYSVLSDAQRILLGDQPVAEDDSTSVDQTHPDTTASDLINHTHDKPDNKDSV